jgi:transposase
VPKILKARLPHDDGEERKVRKLTGARHAPADWSERARIITLSRDGLGVPAIAGRLGCHPKKARRWLHRFNAGGIDGLGDRPGAGRRRRITEAQRSAIIALARSVPPGRLERDGAGELPDGITVHLDAGYDSQKTCAELESRSMKGEIAHKGDKAPIQAGQRWHVERTNAWHNNFNRLQRCYERDKDVIDAFFDLADTIITVRCLIRESWTLYRWDTRPARRP